MKPLKHINVKFEGFDDWGRPVFKDVDTCIRYGSVDLLGYDRTKEEIIRTIKEAPEKYLCYFGSTFNCEPNGGMPAHYRINILDEVAPRYLITGKDRSGKRFRIATDIPQHYNIWQGTLWEIKEGKRKKIKTYYN